MFTAAKLVVILFIAACSTTLMYLYQEAGFMHVHNWPALILISIFWAAILVYTEKK